MSDRYQGGVIRAVPLAPTSSSASGIWTMEQQAKAQAAGDWPAPPPPPYEISRSLRFNSADSAYLSRTPASNGNRKTMTWSMWVKRSGLSSYQELYSASNVYGSGDSILFRNVNSLSFATNGGVSGRVVSCY